jgi:class 3 adenylate cyclase
VTDVPAVRYAKSGDTAVAYQVLGEGPDLVYVPAFPSHLEANWDYPPVARFLRRLASFCRLIVFDKRGTGLSDPVAGVPALEERMDDVRAVMDAVGSDRAALFGTYEGGPICVLFAASHPERTSGLALYASPAKFTQDAEYQWGWSPAAIQLYLAAAEEWGTDRGAELLAPALGEDAEYRRWFSRLLRMSASPRMALSLLRMNTDMDVRAVLPSVHVPTVVLHRRDDAFVDIGHSAYLAEHIDGARFVELAGADHWPWAGDADAVIGEVQELVTGARDAPDADRVLTTVLFTDIVSSTELAHTLGDRRWRDLLERHWDVARRELRRFRGREVKTTGDGVLATFDGPARAVRCAAAIRDASAGLGIELRAGAHTGECEILDGDLSGVAVHVGARIAASAGSGEVLVSSTVKDLTAGAGIEFEDRGPHALKGVEGQWRLFAVRGTP